MQLDDLAVFALSDTSQYGQKVANSLGVACGKFDEIQFPDGEYKVRPLESVRGKHIVLIQSLYADAYRSVDDKLNRLLFSIGSLKDASAKKITAAMPYLAYSRMDRQVESRDPITNKYLAILLEAIGVDHVLTAEVHNLAAFQNAYRCQADHLDAADLFAKHFASHSELAHMVVVSPDAGGLKRARKFRDVLASRMRKDVRMAYVDKTRVGVDLYLNRIVGDIRNCDVIIYDDMISTGHTIQQAAKGCKDAGARKIFCGAAHGLFSGNAVDVLFSSHLDSIVVTDTVDQTQHLKSKIGPKMVVLETTDTFAQAIERIHTGQLTQRKKPEATAA